jgi:hypothetical protein
MATPRLIIDFDSLAESKFQVRTSTVLISMTDNPYFPGEWPVQVPSLAQLRLDDEAYRAACVLVQMRDFSQLGRRNEARRVLTRGLQRLAAYLELVAGDDEEKLKSTGFELRRSSGRPAGSASTMAPGLPDNFRVGLGPRAGTLQIDVSGLRGVIGYEIQITQGDPTSDAGWKPAVIVQTVRRTLLDNLRPGVTWVRLRAVNALGMSGPWTSPISAIVA